MPVDEGSLCMVSTRSIFRCGLWTHEGTGLNDQGHLAMARSELLTDGEHSFSVVRSQLPLFYEMSKSGPALMRSLEAEQPMTVAFLEGLCDRPTLILTVLDPTQAGESALLQRMERHLLDSGIECKSHFNVPSVEGLRTD